MKHSQRVKQRHILRGLDNAFKSIAHEGENIIKGPEKLLSKGLDTVGGLGKSLALPLVIIGGVILISYLNK